ncbi:hypothetical protein M9458_015829, partial [Cirrhinus mrigala]
MADASNVTPFSLLHMRPLQWRLKTKGFSLRGNPLRMMKVTWRCLRALHMWRKPWFENQGLVLGVPCRRVTLATDASLTGWGAVTISAGNCLEMLAVFPVQKHFLPDLRDRHVLVRTNNTAVVYYINHQGGLWSHPLYKLADQILVWSQGKLLSLRAVHVPGHLNMEADVLSRRGQGPGNGCFTPSSTGAEFHGTDVAEAASVRVSPDRSAPGSSGESAPGRGQSTSSSPILARPSMVLGPDFSPRRFSVEDSCQEGSPLTGGGHHPSPPPGAVEAVGVAPEWAQLIASSLSAEVVETIL